MIKFTTFFIIFFTGFQLYSIPVDKIYGVSIEAIRQLVFLYLFISSLFSLFLVDGKLSLNKHVLNIPLLLFLSLLIIGIFYTSSCFYGLTDIVKMLYVTLSFFIFIKFFSIYKDRNSFDFIDKSIIIAFSVFSLGVILNVFYNKGYISPDTGGFLLSGLTGRAVGAMFSSITAIYFYSQYCLSKRFYYFVLFTLASLLVLFSFSRIAIVGFLVTFFIINIWFKKVRYLVVLLGIGLIIYIPFINLLVKETFVGNIESINELRSMRLLDIIMLIRLTGREELWSAAYSGFLASPIWGNGTGYSNYTVKLLTEFVEQVHNDYLKILSDLGIIGLFLYIGIYLSMFNRARKIYLSNKDFFKSLYFIFIVTLIQILIFSFADNVIAYGPYLLVYLFLFYAFLIAAKDDYLRRKTTERNKP